MNIPEELVNLYISEAEIVSSSFELMGKMLDTKLIEERKKLFDISELYIYGGGYLGIQFYRSICDMAKIIAVVDKRGYSQVDIADILVIDQQMLKEMYRGEYIIIASVRYYQEIKKDLCFFVPENKVLYLGEFLGGIVQ